MSSLPVRAVRADDIAPGVFGPGTQDELVDKVDDLEYDAGNLVASDTHPLDPKAMRASTEKHLDKLARDNAQLLIKHVFDLPVELKDVGPVVQLPKPMMPIPREQPPPAEKPLTRWEKFAKEKGIKKKRRSRMVWDDALKDWRPRFGYKRVNDDAYDWAVEVKPGQDPTVDPFEQKKLQKKQRVIKNQLKRVRNAEEATKKQRKSAPVGIPAQLHDAEGFVGGLTGQGRQKRPRPTGESKDVKKQRLRLSQTATASMGKFDNRLEGEPAPPTGAKRQRRMPVEQGGGKERKRQMDVLRKALHGTGEGEAAAAPAGRGGSGGARRGGKKGKKGK